MHRSGSFFEPMMWSMALLLAAFAAGCGSQNTEQNQNTGQNNSSSTATATAAATMPRFGTEQSFAVLGGSTVTNTGSSVITGNLGVSPGTATTGFPPGFVTPPGVIHAADA